MFFLFYSSPELRQGEGFSFLNFLSSLPYPLFALYVQHLYLGESYVVCMVMALLFTDDSLVPFLEEYLHISYLAVLAVPHCLSQQILTSEVKTSCLLTSHSQFQGLGCCLKPRWLIEADKIRREYVFSRECRMAGWRSVGIKTSSGSAEEASAARAGLINMLLIRGSRVALLQLLAYARTANKGGDCDELLDGMNCPPRPGNKQLPHRKAFR